MKTLLFLALTLMAPASFAEPVACAMCTTDPMLQAPYPDSCANECKGSNIDINSVLHFPAGTKIKLNDGTIINVTTSYYSIALNAFQWVRAPRGDGTFDQASGAEIVNRCNN